jgi:hypothetical protein
MVLGTLIGTSFMPPERPYTSPHYTSNALTGLFRSTRALKIKTENGSLKGTSKMFLIDLSGIISLLEVRKKVKLGKIPGAYKNISRKSLL